MERPWPFPIRMAATTTYVGALPLSMCDPTVTQQLRSPWSIDSEYCRDFLAHDEKYFYSLT
jgi:hypothetical protein